MGFKIRLLRGLLLSNEFFAYALLIMTRQVCYGEAFTPPPPSEVFKNSVFLGGGRLCLWQLLSDLYLLVCACSVKTYPFTVGNFACELLTTTALLFRTFASSTVPLTITNFLAAPGNSRELTLFSDAELFIKLA